MGKFLKENWFRISVLFLLLVVALSTTYYFMIFSPAQQRREILSKQQTNENQSLVPGQTQKSADCEIINYLPDPNCTPGEIDPRVTQENINSTICVSGYTTTVRPSTSVTSKIKIERMQVYGDTDSPSNYELDHFIPLELGGSPASILNLFPEPYANPYGATEKDKVENYLHKQVCNGALTLQTAQEEIRSNWTKVYDSCCASTNSTIQNPLNNSGTNIGTDQQNTAGVIKMSSTGICHSPGTTYYARTTNFTPYNSLDECLAAGGRLPKK